MTFLNYIIYVFTNFNWTVAVEIVLLFAIMYILFCFYKKNRAVWFAYAQVIAILLVFIFALIDLPISRALICILAVLLAIFPVALFSSDIRRSLFRITWRDFFSDDKDKEQIDSDLLHKTAEQTVKACLDMSKNDVGALIVFYDQPIDSIIESGTYLNAAFSAELLETLFFPRSPLHDGAVMVVGNRVVAAGCYLPLTARSDLPKEFGTRHRAAIGISEQYPKSTAIVVSEETGIISACHDGKIRRYLSSEDLLKVVQHAMSLHDDREEENAIWGISYEE